MPPERDALGRFKGSGKRRKARRTAPSAAPAPAVETGAAVNVVQSGPSEPFLSELQASWARHGAATIEAVRAGRPHDYLRLMASNLTRHANGEGDPIDAMSDDEVAEELRRVLDRLGAGSAGAGPGAGAAEEA